MAITLDSYFTDSTTGVDRRIDYTSEILLNATKLLQAVNALLVDLGVISIVVTSGWRPPSVNVAIGGAKNSLHVLGRACDLADKSGELKQKIQDEETKRRDNNQESLLRKHGLWMECAESAPTWCHLNHKLPCISIGGFLFS
jgi:hypothetical protein